LQLVLQ